MPNRDFKTRLVNASLQTFAFSLLQLLKFQNVFLKFKLRFLVWLGLKMGTALGIIFVVHSVRTNSKVHLVDLSVSNDPGDSLGTLFLSSTVQENGV